MGQPVGWTPMTREEFGGLERGQLLRDRRGRTWEVTANPFELRGEPHVVIRSGDLVRQLPERYRDEYMRLAAGG